MAGGFSCGIRLSQSVPHVHRQRTFAEQEGELGVDGGYHQSPLQLAREEVQRRFFRPVSAAQPLRYVPATGRRSSSGHGVAEILGRCSELSTRTWIDHEASTVSLQRNAVLCAPTQA